MWHIAQIGSTKVEISILLVFVTIIVLALMSSSNVK